MLEACTGDDPGDVMNNVSNSSSHAWLERKRQMNVELFDESEIKTLQHGATGAGLLVAMSDTGFFDTFKEATAIGTHLDAARNSDSSLIRRVARARGTGFGLTRSTNEIEAGILDALRSASALLQEKAPEELDAYETFVLELAHSVAAAAAGGGNAEASAIAKIEGALGIGPRSSGMAA
jgi:hypothetical protein